MFNTPDSPAKTPGGYTTQGGNFWTLITPEIWKVLHAVLQPKTKNGYSRTVPLSSTAVAILNDQPRSLSGVVFATSPTAITEGFQRVAKKANLADFHFHDLRHCAVSRLAKILQMHELAKMAGHRSPKSVMRYYKQDDADLVRKLG
jgi:integrase